MALAAVRLKNQDRVRRLLPFTERSGKKPSHQNGSSQDSPY